MIGHILFNELLSIQIKDLNCKFLEVLFSNSRFYPFHSDLLQNIWLNLGEIIHFMVNSSFFIITCLKIHNMLLVNCIFLFLLYISPYKYGCNKIKVMAAQKLLLSQLWVNIILSGLLVKFYMEIWILTYFYYIIIFFYIFFVETSFFPIILYNIRPR